VKHTLIKGFTYLLTYLDLTYGDHTALRHKPIFDISCF